MSSLRFQATLSLSHASAPRCSLVAGDFLSSQSRAATYRALCGPSGSFCHQFRGLKLWIYKNLNIKLCNSRYGQLNTPKLSKVDDSDLSTGSLRVLSSYEDQLLNESGAEDVHEETSYADSVSKGSSTGDVLTGGSPKAPSDGSLELVQTHSFDFSGQEAEGPSLCIAIVGATGDLARRKIFPALFALYYSGFLPENFGIFGYSRRNLTDADLRSLIASTLTCRVDHQENCESKMNDFLSKTFYIYGGYDNQEGMVKLNAKMSSFEGKQVANRIFYLSVPQEVVLEVASCIAMKAQTLSGWNRIIIEKPFGFNALSSHGLTQSLLTKFEENQIYRIDHLLGRNLIENLTVLRFANLVFEPLWSRKYVRNVQVILSEQQNLQSQSSSFDKYGVIRDMVHSHILQTIALLAMEPPISLDGEDIRNEKVKVLRSVGKLEPSNVILGKYKSMSEDKIDVPTTSLSPTFFAAAFYINNARWDGVPFLVRVGTGLIKHRMEIRIQFDHVPGNIYRERMGHNIDLATNELILRDVPDEAILIRINNKVPGLSLRLDASELNLLYRDKYNVEVPDSYEHLILDVVDGDNHLFMRSDELAAAWNILTPVLQEIDRNNISPELYELGGRGPIGAYYLWAKHGVRWLED